MSDLFFEKIQFKNFMSFGNVFTEVDLSTPGTYLLIGENLDEGGSSGAGKSTVLNALSYVIYDVEPEGVKKDMLINNINESKDVLMEVELYFRVGKDSYIIKRTRGKTNSAYLIKNGIDITTTPISKLNVDIEEIIGFSYVLFSQVVQFNGNTTPFLSLPGPKQRELIEELLRITILSKKAEALKILINATESDLKIQNALIEQQKVQAGKHEQLVISSMKRITDWDDHHTNSIQTAKNTLIALQAIDFEAEEQLHNLIIQVTEQSAPIDMKISSLNSEKSMKNREVWIGVSKLNSTQSKLKLDEKNYLKIESELTHLKDAKCPYCLQKFLDTKSKIESLEKEYKEIEYSITILSSEIFTLKEEEIVFNNEKSKSIKMIDEKIKEHQNEKLEFVTQLKELTAALSYKTYKDHVNAANMSTVIEKKIDDLEKEVNPHLDALESLEQISPVKIDMSKIDELMKIRDHQKILHKLLTDKNSYIRKDIIGKTLPFLNNRIDHYVKKMHLPHNINFQSDMTCEITRYGLSLGHGNLSNGERKRLNIGLCFAFRDVLTYLHSNVNLLLTDEVDGGSLDEQSVNSLVSVIKTKAWDDKIAFFIVSHRPEFEGKCDHNWAIRKERGFSSLHKIIS